MHPRRAGGQRLLRVDHRRQHFVVDTQQPRRLARDGLGVRGDGSDDLADVAHLALGESRLVLDECAHAVAIAQVVAGDDGAHAGQRQRGLQVVAADARVRMRALHDGGMQHAGTRQVGDELGAAGELLVALQLRNRRAHGVHGGAHAADSARSAAAAARTAWTMVT